MCPSPRVERRGSSRLSSVVIENGNQGFVISVRRRPGVSVSPIDLTVKFPESARVAIETGNGKVSLKGVPSSITVKSLAGDLDVELPESANADVFARATKGSVKSELSESLSENGHPLQTRLGNGARTLRLNLESGNITLSVSNSRDFGAQPEIRKSPAPALSGSSYKSCRHARPFLRHSGCR